MEPAKEAAAMAVVAQIDVYGGEEIVANEHPLWLAIVALEKLSKPAAPPLRSHNALDTGFKRLWLFGLWASRPGVRNVAKDGRTLKHKNAHPKLAMYWLRWLRRELLNEVAGRDPFDDWRAEIPRNS